MSNLDKLQQLNTNTPRETLVVAADGLVFKRPVIKANSFSGKVWLEKQHIAQKVQDSLQKNSGKYYFVPRMLEISEQELFAVEQRVLGKPVTEKYFATLSEEDKNIIYLGLAHFLNDINQSKPVLTQRDVFDIPEHKGDLPFARILKKLEKHLTKKEINILKMAQQWFDAHSPTDASVVFCQGDMNEHNIFYDPQTKTLSFIDFADARYENARDMFHRDIARLLWVDIDRLVKLYTALPRKQSVNTQTNPTVEKMRNILQNIKWSGAEVINADKKLFNIRLGILKSQIAELDKYYRTIEAQDVIDAIKTTKKLLNDSSIQK